MNPIFKQLLQPILALSMFAASGTAAAQFANQNSQQLQYQELKKYDNDDYVPISSTPQNVDEGWEGLARLLKKLEPAADTSLPESRTQIALRINGMIGNGQHAAALKEIQHYESEDARISSPASDVQLKFLKGRALEGLGRHADAMAVYQQMAYQYPELAEPWNNLAVLQMKAGLTDNAYESLMMAVQIRPNYGLAQKNLGLVNLLKAREAFSQAAKNGVRTDPQTKALDLILSGQKPKKAQ